jgi:hypothetical protein
MKPIYFLLFLMHFLLMNCGSVEINEDIPDTSGKICINGTFTQDSAWTIYVTKGKHILDNNPIRQLADADVVILEDNKILTTLHSFGYSTINQNIGGYTSYKETTLVPKPGKTYQLKASYPGLPDVTTSCFLPMPVPIHNVELTHSSELSKAPIDIYFYDPPNEENFYSMECILTMESKNYNTGESPKYVVREKLYTSNPLYYLEEDFDIINSTSAKPIFFSDKQFDGQLIKIASIINASERTNVIKAEVILNTLSKEFYLYKTTKARQAFAENDPFAQPVQVYNNVQNGFGIFIGFSQYAYEVK